MAINTNSGEGTTTNYVGFSSFLGSLTLETAANKKAYADAKALVGEAVVKKSFSGLGTDSATAKARKHLKEAKVPVGFSISGKLKNVFYRENEDPATKNKYENLRVFLQDEVGGVKENTILTLDMGSDLAQKLIQKLEYAIPGEEVEIGAWSSLEANPKDPDGPLYAKHNVSVKQNGLEVKVAEGVKHYDVVKVLVDEKYAKLEGADFKRAENKEMFAKARKSVGISYFKEILGRIEAHYKTTAAEHEESDQHHVASESDEGGASYEDGEFSIDPAAAVPGAK
ncbi:MAG: hypothetical protein Q7K26_01755 [bacterium]|nr:hypothetical protein [bacterium]